MLIIRFARRGRNKQAFFEMVVAESSRAVGKKSIARLGYYDPHTEAGKGKFVFDVELVKKYVGNGAQISQAVARLLVKNGFKEAESFIQKRVTKPKKEVATSKA